MFILFTNQIVIFRSQIHVETFFFNTRQKRKVGPTDILPNHFPCDYCRYGELANEI